MTRRSRATVNTAVYTQLGDRWYDADDDPVALLRAQARLHVPWISSILHASFERGTAPRVLDLGCGAGFVANALAARGHDVVGVDIAEASLAVAARHDSTGRVRYVHGDAHRLPFGGRSFDAVCAMDFLEHVEPLDAIVSEVARVLAPNGLFFFHTFNRNVVSMLVVIQAVALLLRNVPRDLHVLRLFIRPSELRATCAAHGLFVEELVGCRPERSGALLKMLVTGVVPPNFAFRFSRGTLTGYSGVARRVA